MFVWNTNKNFLKMCGGKFNFRFIYINKKLFIDMEQKNFIKTTIREFLNENIGNTDTYNGYVDYNEKEIEYNIRYDWDLGMNGEWEFIDINYNGEDIRDYDVFSDDDVNEIKRLIIKKIQKETGRRYY
jgi:hypothetical protein